MKKVMQEGYETLFRRRRQLTLTVEEARLFKKAWHPEFRSHMRERAVFVAGLLRESVRSHYHPAGFR